MPSKRQKRKKRETEGKNYKGLRCQRSIGNAALSLSLTHTDKTSVGPAVAPPTASPARLFQRPAQETSGSVDRVQETGAGGQRRADGQGEDRSLEQLDVPLAGVVAGRRRRGLLREREREFVARARGQERKKRSRRRRSRKFFPPSTPADSRIAFHPLHLSFSFSSLLY